ncbi:glycine betaine ABC transporter substrate-binding protein [Gordonia sp. (in: high G+C Gram-positive bacteria)]|uniref:glycine betaine ABC transporter substrate-binding protein n=1 Tax=Gordonia sp. (in: high G+C Gram-positive bacteria) TaxID=84139 RepID=UPI003C73676D
MAIRGFFRRTAVLVATAATAATLLSACGSDNQVPLRVSSDGTVSMRVAAQVYAKALARTGVRVDVTDEVAGDRRLLERAAEGEVDLFPAFTGDLLTTLTPAPTAVTGDEVATAVNRALPQGVTIGDPASVSNRRQLVVAENLIGTSGLADLSDCAVLPVGLPLVTTGVLTSEERRSFDVCRFGSIVDQQSPAQVLAAVRDSRALGTLTGLEAAGTLAGQDAVVAVRSADAGPMAEDLVPVFRSGSIGKSQMKALSRVAGELTTADVVAMSNRVAKGADPAVVASEWVSTHGV